MDNKQSMTVADYGGRDQYATCQAREKALNEAILQADISENFERYLELFDASYADDLEVSSEMQGAEPSGKGQSALSSGRFSRPTSRNGRSRWFADICPRESHC